MIESRLLAGAGFDHDEWFVELSEVEFFGEREVVSEDFFKEMVSEVIWKPGRVGQGSSVDVASLIRAIEF